MLLLLLAPFSMTAFDFESISITLTLIQEFEDLVMVTMFLGLHLDIFFSVLALIAAPGIATATLLTLLATLITRHQQERPVTAARGRRARCGGSCES